MEPNVAVAGWPDQAETFLSFINSYRSKQMFCDCTLACDGKFFRGHKIILSMCSEFFENIFSITQDKNPVIILNEVEAWQIECLLNYMYKGETSVPDSRFNSLCRVAKCLHIKGFDMVELHRKAVKMSKQRDSSQSLERQQPADDCSCKYLPSKYSSTNQLSVGAEYNNSPASRTSNVKCYKRKRCFSHDLQECGENDGSSLDRGAHALPHRVPSHSCDDYHQRQEDEHGYSSEMNQENYREHQSSTPKKTFRNGYNTSLSESNPGNLSSKWTKSDQDYYSPSLCAIKSETQKFTSSHRDCRSDSPRSSAPYHSYCYKENEITSSYSPERPSAPAAESHVISPREKDNKENETPCRRSPPGLLPSRLLKQSPPELSPARCSPSTIGEIKRSDTPQPTPSLAQQRGPPPLLKLVNNDLDDEDLQVEDNESKSQHFFKTERRTSPPPPNVKGHSFIKSNPYHDSVFQPSSKTTIQPPSKCESPKNTLQITPVPSKSIEYVKSKSLSPGNISEFPLNLTNGEKSKSEGHPSPPPEPDDPLLRKIQTNKRKRVRGPKSWEFLLRLLRDPLSNPSLIKWEDEPNGIFRLIRPEIIAQRWGRRTGKHGNDILSYESFARGLRYHYATGALNAVSEKSFVYQFGPKAEKTLLGVDRIPEKETNFEMLTV